MLVMKKKVKKVKKVLSMVMFGAMMMSGLVMGGQPVEGKAADATPEPVLYYDFEGEADTKSVTDKAGENHPTLTGRVKIEYNEATESNVLNFQGRGGYLEFPRGFFDGRDTMTISLDVYSKMDNTNFLLWQLVRIM